MENFEENLHGCENSVDTPNAMNENNVPGVYANNAVPDASTVNMISIVKDVITEETVEISSVQKKIDEVNFEKKVNNLFKLTMEKFKEARNMMADQRNIAEESARKNIANQSIKLMEEAICILKEAQQMCSARGCKFLEDSAIKALRMFEAVLSSWKPAEKLSNEKLQKKTVMERIIEMNQRNKNSKKEESPVFKCCETCTALSALYRSITPSKQREARIAEKIKTTEKLLLKLHRNRFADGNIDKSAGTMIFKRPRKIKLNITVEESLRPPPDTNDDAAAEPLVISHEESPPMPSRGALE